ncbi:MAG: DUF465 domain-containing protein [Acidobacteriota bacterium]
MTADAPDVTSTLVQTDDEFRELSSKHKELEHRLSELAGKTYLSEPELVEEATIKKRKLQLKDRMEDIVRRFRGEHGPEVLMA